jgi:hypothetical protein
LRKQKAKDEAEDQARYQAEVLRREELREANLRADRESQRANALAAAAARAAPAPIAPSLSPSAPTFNAAVEVTQPPMINFRSTVVCDGDRDRVLDYSTANDKMAIVLPLKEWCYGPVVILPESWRYRGMTFNHQGVRRWMFTNATSDPGWIAFLAVDEGDEVRPVGLDGDINTRGKKYYPAESAYGGTTFRLQGRGTVRFVLQNRRQ